MRKGFTLIELLVVLTLTAVLALVVILTLNPAELLRQTRDSSRISDMSTLKNLMGLYVTDRGQSALPTGAWCYVTTAAAPAGKCGVFSSSVSATTTNVGVQNINGTGWIPLDFTSMSANSPVLLLPVDPRNNGTFYYAYVASTTDGGTYKIVASRMESARYQAGGAGDVVSTDGGTNPNALEVGTGLSL